MGLKDLGIRQKFFALAGLIGLIMAVVSCAGYYTAYTNLSESVTKEMMATVETQGQSLDGWVKSKSQAAVSTANMLEALDANSGMQSMHEMTFAANNDKEVLDMTNGSETGTFMSWSDGDHTGELDPKTRPWYQDAKKEGKLIYTEAYQDALNGKLIFSAVAPYNDKSGAFKGAVCEDISLDVLADRVKELKYRGEGKGIIIEKEGKILASTNDSEAFTEISSHAVLKDHFKEMVTNGSGFFEVEADGEDEVFAYTTVPSTGWVVGISVPTSYVFSQLTALKITYGILTIVGILIIVLVSLLFSKRITTAIIGLREHADELAKGNLRVDDLAVESADELGVLAQAFNTMSHNIRSLIKKMAATSEQVAASSEELTASAQQSAEASNHVAGTVSEVASGMADQMTNVDKARQDVDRVSEDIMEVAAKTKRINEASLRTAEAAQNGQKLMNEAMSRMESIETSVGNSAEVVKALGANSQQIGQIVDAIAAIADQTNLLALNAAIEAARAGEYGRGFAVVAEEVRKLAAESQGSAEQIKERIASIQTDTEKAVQAMQDGTNEVQNGTEAIKNVGTQFTEIIKMVTDIHSQMEDIDASVQTVSTGATRIVDAVDSIDNVSRATSDHTQTISAATEEQSASTEEIASASQALAQMAVELQEATGKFRV